MSGEYLLNVAAMSNAEIDAALDTLYRLQIKLQNKLVDEGRGLEQPKEHGRWDDPTSASWRENESRIRVLQGELKKRGAWKPPRIPMFAIPQNETFVR